MKLKKLIIENFRGYSEKISVDFDDLIVFVGKNDAGKSTILHALDIFFNDGKDGVVKAVKIDTKDFNIYSSPNGDDKEITISAEFGDLPNDDGFVKILNYEDNSSDKFVLNRDDVLKIVKKYSKQEDSKIKTTVSIFYNDNALGKIKTKERKEIMKYLPQFSLFQLDELNGDQDGEIQNPLKRMLKEVLRDPEISEKLKVIEDEIKKKLEEISTKLNKELGEWDKENISRKFKLDTSAVNWDAAFKSWEIIDDQGIQIKKRGSGWRKLILLCFLKIEVEREKNNDSAENSIIYAVEEPEISQHTKNQKMLVEMLINLSRQGNTQVIFTTHSPSIVKYLEDIKYIRIIRSDSKGEKRTVKNAGEIRISEYKSLNEVNYLAFEEISEGYHNELYGYLDGKGWLKEYERDREKVEYKKENKKIKPEKISKTRRIRHQIHHPENTLNERYSVDDLKESIKGMREFIKIKNEKTEAQEDEVASG